MPGRYPLRRERQINARKTHPDAENSANQARALCADLCGPPSRRWSLSRHADIFGDSERRFAGHQLAPLGRDTPDGKTWSIRWRGHRSGTDARRCRTRGRNSRYSSRLPWLGQASDADGQPQSSRQVHLATRAARSRAAGTAISTVARLKRYWKGLTLCCVAATAACALCARTLLARLPGKVYSQMPSNGAGHNHHSFDPDATGASQPLPANEPGAPSREKHERDAAFARGEAKAGGPAYALCAPDVPGLRAELLFTLLAENVRDYAVFVMDTNGIIRCWNEGARLMKWWTRQQAEGAHLRILYRDGGSEDGTAEEHLRMGVETGEYTGDGNRVRSDGSTLWAYTVLTALRDDEGRLVGFAKVTRDFTARRAVEAALTKQAQSAPESQRILEEVNRQKVLVASISHELRSPLNAMMGASTPAARTGIQAPSAHKRGQQPSDDINKASARAASFHSTILVSWPRLFRRPLLQC